MFMLLQRQWGAMTRVIIAKDQLMMRVLVMIGIHHLLYLPVCFVKKFGKVQNRTVHKQKCTIQITLRAWTRFTVHTRA